MEVDPHTKSTRCLPPLLASSPVATYTLHLPSPLALPTEQTNTSKALVRSALRRIMGWGEPPPAPAPPQRKAASGGGLAALKLLLTVLLVGLALRLLVDPAASYLVSSTTTPVGEAAAIAAGGRSMDSNGNCDLFRGEWVPDSSGPAYTNASCRFIETPQNCMTNGRPDTGYLYWRWKPYGCDVPRFQVEEPTEVYHDKTFKSRKWHIASHNITVSLIWAPFLVKAETFEDEDGVSTSEIQLHLDILDSNWTRQWNSFDYVVISTGQWFLKTAVYWENGAVRGCHYCQNKSIKELTFEYAFRKSLRKSFQFITSSPHKPLVFYRTWSPSHFENGDWSSGGTCKRTVPFKPGEAGDREWDKKMWRIEREEFARVAAHNKRNSADRLKLLDTFELSLLRPDGHSGPYRTYHPFKNGTTGKVQNDCLHWCLPGPIDAWNDIIMQMLAMN
uniref:Uncharacterized protein n=1 Tax=Leersia perrieri TaxID=77586 RepID=A0A0D9WQT1_9ORYZ